MHLVYLPLLFLASAGPARFLVVVRRERNFVVLDGAGAGRVAVLTLNCAGVGLVVVLLLVERDIFLFCFERFG